MGKIGLAHFLATKKINIKRFSIVQFFVWRARDRFVVYVWMKDGAHFIPFFLDLLPSDWNVRLSPNYANYAMGNRPYAVIAVNLVESNVLW